MGQIGTKFVPLNIVVFDYIGMETIEYTYVIPTETPAKKNSRIVLKNGKNIPSERFQKWHSFASLYLITQKRPERPIDYPITVEFLFIHSDNKPRDCDNQASSILDLLQDSLIIKNDCWQIVRQVKIFNKYKKNCAECLVRIVSYNDTEEVKSVIE